MAKSKTIRAALALVLFAVVALQNVFTMATPLRDSTRAPAAIKPYSRKSSKEAIKWADQQLKRMSLEEKVGQMISVGVNATFLNQDSEAFKALRHQVVDNHVGGIILFRGPVYESVMLVNRMQALAKYPLLALFQEFLRTHGAMAALMSGSGSTTFGLVNGQAAAERLREEFNAKFGENFWTTIVPVPGTEP